MTLKLRKETVRLLLIAGGVILTFVLLTLYVKSPAEVGDGRNINLLAVFLTGLLTGGLTCLAVQGGLLAATLAQREEERLKEETKKTGNAVPILSFLMAKLLAYTILGLLLGWFGSLFTLSLSTMAILQVAVGIFMIGTAFNMLNIHPLFRYFVIQPPRFLTRFVRKKSKSGDIFAPALVGALTVFIPCGTTQAMMALAIASANPGMGTLIMFAFVLGTSPVFFLLGYFTTKLSETMHKSFMRFAAVGIILLSLFTINNALTILGSPLTLQSAKSAVKNQVTTGDINTVNEATITIDNEGYTPRELSVRAGDTVKLNLVNDEGLGCQQAFTIPQLRFQKVVRPGQSYSFEFKAPETKGDIAFMCSMGMFTGVIHVL